MVFLFLCVLINTNKFRTQTNSEQMAQQQFNPTPDVTTHSDARTLFNVNFQDAEDRLASLEGINIENRIFSAEQDILNLSASGDYKLKIIGISSSAGVLNLDASEAYAHAITLDEDVVNFSIQNSDSGEGGSLIVRQDDAGGWAIDFGEAQIIDGFSDSITGIAPSGSGACFVTWFDDGIDLTIAIGAPYPN